MDVTNVETVLTAQRYAGKAEKGEIKETEFFSRLQRAAESDASQLEDYQKHLEERFGKILVKHVGKDQRSMDALGYGTFGAGNVVIAPNILKEMANDPRKAAHYEQKIQEHFDSIPQTKAFMAAMGHRMISSGVVIHSDGTVTYYLCGEESPETKAKVEAENKAKGEKKAKRRRENVVRSLEMAIKRNQSMTAFLTGHIQSFGGYTCLGISDTPDSVYKKYQTNANRNIPLKEVL